MEKDVNGSSEHREKEYKEDPGQFVGGFFLFVQDVNADYYAESYQDIFNITKGHHGTEYEEKDESQLYEYQGNDKQAASEYYADPFFFHWPKPAIGRLPV